VLWADPVMIPEGLVPTTLPEACGEDRRPALLRGCGVCGEQADPQDPVAFPCSASSSLGGTSFTLPKLQRVCACSKG